MLHLWPIRPFKPEIEFSPYTPSCPPIFPNTKIPTNIFRLGELLHNQITQRDKPCTWKKKYIRFFCELPFKKLSRVLRNIVLKSFATFFRNYLWLFANMIKIRQNYFFSFFSIELKFMLRRKLTLGVYKGRVGPG